MWRTISLYIHSIRYLKCSQLFFQLWYPVKNILFNSWYPYTKYQNARILDVANIKTQIEFNIYNAENNTFTFLNKSHTFSDRINWQFQGHGKLWNYNLQYLNVLHDETISAFERQKVLIQLSESINSSSLHLESYPVSLRIMNTLLFYSNVTSDHATIKKALFKQIHFLESNLEYHILANHLLENYIALCVAAVFIGDDNLWNKIHPKLDAELKVQILADGAHFERSPMYHSIILYRLILLYQVLLHNNKYMSDYLDKCIQRMGTWLFTICLPDARFPLFQDCCTSVAPTARWILDTMTQLGFKVEQGILTESAYCKLERGPIVLYVNAGNISPYYQPGHAHADMLHFDLYFNGHAIFSDPGISTYEPGPQRQYERSTAAHNTVVINGLNQSEMWAQFRVARRAAINIGHTDNHYLEGTISNYAGRNWSHRRIFDVQSNQIIIEDLVFAKDTVSSVMYLHCHHSVKRINMDYEKNIIHIDGLQLQILNAQHIVLEEDYQAVAFNQLIKSKKICIYFNENLKTILTWHE